MVPSPATDPWPLFGRNDRNPVSTLLRRLRQALGSHRSFLSAVFARHPGLQHRCNHCSGAAKRKHLRQLREQLAQRPVAGWVLLDSILGPKQSHGPFANHRRCRFHGHTCVVLLQAGHCLLVLMIFQRLTRSHGANWKLSEVSLGTIMG